MLYSGEGYRTEKKNLFTASASPVELNPYKSCSVVVVTAVLHNIAVKENVQLFEEEEGGLAGAGAGADGEEDGTSGYGDDLLNTYQGKIRPAGAEVRQLFV